MFLDGLDADAELVRGLLVGLSLGDQLEDLHLARGQADVSLRAPVRIAQARVLLAIVEALWRRADRRTLSLCGLRRIALERMWAEVCLIRYPAAPMRITSSTYSSSLCAERIRHLGGGNRFENLPGGFQAIEQRHRDVHDDDGREELLGQSAPLRGRSALRRRPRMPSSASNKDRSPARTTAWSSASKTVIGFIS